MTRHVIKNAILTVLCEGDNLQDLAEACEDLQHTKRVLIEKKPFDLQSIKDVTDCNLMTFTFPR